MTAYTQRLLIIVPAARQAAANAAAKLVDPDGGERAFTVGLSPTGNPPATHYWCSWQMTPVEEAIFRSQLGGLAGHRTTTLSHFDPQEARPRPEDERGALNLQPIRTP